MKNIQKLLMLVVAAGVLLTVGVARADDAVAPAHHAHHKGHHHGHKKGHHHKGRHHAAKAERHEPEQGAPSDNRNHDFDNLNR